MQSKSFDDWHKVRGVFLDISKAFDKVRHNELICKLKQNGVSGNLLNLIIDFLDTRKQSVVLNGQYFSWRVLQQELLKDQFKIEKSSIWQEFKFANYIKYALFTGT